MSDMDNKPINIQKYENYKEQFKRLKMAMSHCFYLEAMFICYIVGYLGWKAVNHISYIMEKAKIDSIAEVIEIIPRADITNQGEVFVKIVLTE